MTAVVAMVLALTAQEKQKLYLDPIDVKIRPLADDPTVKIDYDIVYVRAHRAGDEVHKRFYADFATPTYLQPGADLMLLHPDGTEERLVEGGEGAIQDPYVSFDGEWVFYTRIHTMEGAGPWSLPKRGADIYKIHVPTRKIVRLTNQEFTPNLGAADWATDPRKPEKGKTHLPYGVLNMGPCPIPGGRVVFTSSRNGFRPPKGYPRATLQLFVMDDDGANVEQIGFLNIACALHPAVLKDGTILFSSLENQGIRGDILWGIWRINPDGSYWAPVVSAFDPGGAPNGYHFQTELSDGSLVIEGYYNLNNSGFGTYIKIPAGASGFGPAYRRDPRNTPWRMGRFYNGKPRNYTMGFMPTGSVSLTPFATIRDAPADPSILGDKTSPAVGKFTHPSGAPDNHLLTIYSPGPVNHQYKHLPQLDGGIYLLKDGRVLNEPAGLLLIKNDPKVNEQWPRALVPYKRIYGVDEPGVPEQVANDGSLSRHLPEGTPFGLVGTSSLYKRESYPDGVVHEGTVTAAYPGGKDPWKGLDALTSHGNGMPINWHNQGADAGLYGNDEIHAIRILVMEPTTDRKAGERSGRLFASHAHERLRILGEIPVRKFLDGRQPEDPDGNPDTSFLARIPADTAFTFQTLDKDGLVLNMSQTWHQLRPGEIRNDCGGCHAHSQKPTLFSGTMAAKPDYGIFDLTRATPLLTDRKRDESGRQWDAKSETGLRTVKGPLDVEFFRHIRPILRRSCTPCHTKDQEEPAGNLVLDDDAWIDVQKVGRVPGTYARLAADNKARWGHKPVSYDSWGYPQASRTVRMFQSRRSLLAWKIFGRRLDGFTNDDHPSEPEPGAGRMVHHGKEVEPRRGFIRSDIDYHGSIMPPPKAVETGKVPPLSDEERRTIVRWIDLGCPIDLDFDADHPERRGYGWTADDNRPVLALTLPRAGRNARLDRILVGAFDYYSGLDPDSLSIKADFDIDGAKAGEELIGRFARTRGEAMEWKLKTPIAALRGGTLTVTVKDRAGNVSRIDRRFSVGR